MKQVGKKTKEWLKILKQWKKDHPPNFQGYYTCHICKGWVHESEVTLDHVIPRSNAKNYTNRHDDSNLQPAHGLCNNEKGSKKY